MKKTPFFRRCMPLLVVFVLMGCLFPSIYAAEETGSPSEETIQSATDWPEEENVTPSEQTNPETGPEETAGKEDASDWELQEGETIAPIDAISLFTLSPGSTMTISKETAWYCGDVTFYYRGASDNRYGPFNTSSAVYFTLSDGRIGYCIQPQKSGATGTFTASEWIESYMDDISQKGCALAMAYGAPNNGDTSEAGIKATALLVWDMICGYRNINGTLRNTNRNAPFYRAISDTTIKEKYDAILTKLANHGQIPSFSAPKRTGIGEAQTITLQLDSASGLYTASVTDSNGVLADFHYSSDIAGVTFRKDGNTLNITATKAAAEKLTSGVIIQSRGFEVEVGPDVCTVWQSAEYSNKQLVLTLDGPTDPVPSYFKLQAEALTGNLTVKKTSTNGTGGSFRISVYGSGMTTIADKYLAVGESFTLTGLEAGTYNIREWNTNGWYCTNASTTDSASGWWTVTVTAGGTSSVTIVTINNEPCGKVRIKKTTNTGSNLSGWKFNIYSDAECANLVAGPLISAADGTITSGYLKPGTYYVQEVEEKEQYPGWTFDTTVRKVFVTAGQTAEVKFTNALRPGRISIQKVDAQGEPLAGASFRLEWSDDGGNTWKAVTYSDEADVVKGGCSNPNLMDGCLTSGEDGVVEWGNLYPGIRYRITEVEAPEGCQLLIGPAFEGAVSVEDDLTVELTVVNAPVYELPMTGSTGSRWRTGLQLAGAFALLAMIFYLAKKRG